MRRVRAVCVRCAWRAYAPHMHAQGVTGILPKHLKRLNLGEGDAAFLRLLVAQVGSSRCTLLDYAARSTLRVVHCA